MIFGRVFPTVAWILLSWSWSWSWSSSLAFPIKSYSCTLSSRSLLGFDSQQRQQQQQYQQQQRQERRAFHPKKSLLRLSTSDIEPQVLATGYSQNLNLIEAIEEACELAILALPKPTTEASKIDLALISISSLYDGSTNMPPSKVVPAVLQACQSYGHGIQHLIGSTVGGFVSSLTNWDYQQTRTTTTMSKDSTGNNNNDNDNDNLKAMERACLPVELEGLPGVSVTLCILPDVSVKVCVSDLLTVVRTERNALDFQIQTDIKYKV